MKKAVFIERDGILNEFKSSDSKEQAQPIDFREFKLKPEAFGPLKKLNDAGYRIIVLTNQPGISRGTQFRGELDKMHEVLKRTFPPISDIFLCPHHDDDHCPCRMPKQGLIVEATFKWKLSLCISFVITQSWQMADAGRNSGCKVLLIKSPLNGRQHKYFTVPNLEMATQKILATKTP